MQINASYVKDPLVSYYTNKAGMLCRFYMGWQIIPEPEGNKGNWALAVRF